MEKSLNWGTTLRTRLLIEQGINEALIPHGATDIPIKQVVSLIRDQQAAMEGLFDFVGGQRNLSTSYIKQLHQVLTQSQDSTEALGKGRNIGNFTDYFKLDVLLEAIAANFPPSPGVDPETWLYLNIVLRH
nr:hypothetical protein [Arthrospira sp. SH-MAG29]